MPDPAPRVVGVREDAGRGGHEHGRGLVVDVEDGGGGEPATLGEDQVGGDPQTSLGLCILKKKGLRPCMRAKAMPARM